MATTIELTPKLLESIQFEQQLIQKTKGGKVTLKATPPEVRCWEVNDSEIQGFSIRVTRGTVGWYVRKRMGALGPQRRCMGNYPDLKATDARKRARVWLGMMEQGIDPNLEKRKRIEEVQLAKGHDKLTMKKVYEAYILDKDSKSKKSTKTDRRKVLGWMTGAPIWTMSIFEINDAAVKATFGPLLAGLAGGERPKWGPKSLSTSTIQKLYTYVSAAYMREALKHRIVLSKADGPFFRWRADQKIEKAPAKTKHLPMGEAAGHQWLKGLYELAERAHDPRVLINKVSASGEGIKPHVSVLADFFLCVLLWGARKEEAAKARWQDVDFERKYIVFPETKSGVMGAIPLTPWAMEILNRRKRANDMWRPDEANIWVFPSRQHGRAIADPRSIAVTLAKETGLMITPHDLRRTLATELNKVEVKAADVGRLLLVGAALNHSAGRSGGTVSKATPGYIQEKVEAIRPAFQTRENKIRRILELPVLAAAEPKEAALADGTMEALIELSKSNPDVKRRLIEALMN